MGGNDCTGPTWASDIPYKGQDTEEAFSFGSESYFIVKPTSILYLDGTNAGFVSEQAFQYCY